MNKLLVVFLICIFCFHSVFSQNTDNQALYYAEEMPEPTFDIPKFLNEHISYPLEAKNKNIQGKVYIQFIVDTLGNVSNVKVLKSPSQLLDSECIKVVNLFPKFKPGKQNGKAVSVYYTIPITFKLEDAKSLEIYDSSTKNPVYAYADQLPEPTVDLQNYFDNHIQLPKIANENGVCGEVYLKCLLDENGNILNAKVIRSSHYILDSEAIRVVKTLPKWQPAIINNKRTSVYIQINVGFSDKLINYIDRKFNIDKIPTTIDNNTISNFSNPNKANDNNIQGKVYVNFYIDKNDNIMYPHVRRLGNPDLDSEAINVVKAMPIDIIHSLNRKFHPKTVFTLPIVFKKE